MTHRLIDNVGSPGTAQNPSRPEAASVEAPDTHNALTGEELLGLEAIRRAAGTDRLIRQVRGLAMQLGVTRGGTGPPIRVTADAQGSASATANRPLGMGVTVP